jgi:chromate transporter
MRGSVEGTVQSGCRRRRPSGRGADTHVDRADRRRSFLWIFLGAPYVEALRGNRHLTAALASITAAVVGVILNLAVWFAVHAVFAQVDERAWHGVRLLVPRWDTVPVPALVLSLGALVAAFRYRVGLLPLLGACAGLGVLYWTLARAA